MTLDFSRSNPFPLCLGTRCAYMEPRADRLNLGLGFGPPVLAWIDAYLAGWESS